MHSADPLDKNRRMSSVVPRALTLVLAPLVGFLVTIVGAPQAHAAGTFDNAAIADRALAYVGRWGGDACRDAAKSEPYPGQCRGFVNCIVKMIGGMNLGGADYFQSFLAAGGREIGTTNALAKGDIVQVGQGVHTFIIVGRKAGNTFGVVDSNHMNNERVMHYDRTFALGGNTRAFRMGSVRDTTAGQPMGALDATTARPGVIEVGGWAADRDGGAPIRVEVFGGDGERRPGNPSAGATANSYRPDVHTAHPGFGTNHGYSIGLPTPGPGQHTVCAYAINTPGTLGGDVKLGCRIVTAIDRNAGFPKGALDVVTAKPGQVEAGGWSADPDAGQQIQVEVYGGDGTRNPRNPHIATTANTSRPDVHTAYPGFGPNHGFSVALPIAAPGVHTVCAYGINTPGTLGNDARLGCRNVTVPNPPAPAVAPAKAPQNFRVNADCGVNDCALHWNQPDLRGGELLYYRIGGSVEGRSLPEQQVRVSAARFLASQVNSCKPVYFWIYAVTSNPANGKQMDGGGALTPSEGRCRDVSRGRVVKRPPVTSTPVAAPAKKPRTIEQEKSSRTEDPGIVGQETDGKPGS